ncbi:MAG: CoA transferase, partial [Hyphomicrobiales bacterium]
IFPSRGDDAWIAIAARDDGDWRRLASALGRDDLGSDPRFATLAGRKQFEDELEAEIAKSTRSRDGWELASELLAAGVPAAPLETIRDHLERDTGTGLRYAPIHHPYGSEFLVVNQFIRPRGEVVPNRRAPMIGEHSDWILREVLGKSAEEIAALTVDGVID